MWEPVVVGRCSEPLPRRTTACRRPLIASARASLRLSAAPEAQRSAPRGGSGLAGESWRAAGSLPRRCQGCRSSSQRRVRGLVSPPRAVARRAGVGCAAPLPCTRARLGSSVPCGRPLCRMPCAMGVRRARHAERGLACGRSTVSHTLPAVGVARCGGPGVSVSSWPGVGAVPPAAAGVSW